MRAPGRRSGDGGTLRRERRALERVAERYRPLRTSAAALRAALVPLLTELRELNALAMQDGDAGDISRAEGFLHLFRSQAILGRVINPLEEISELEMLDAMLARLATPARLKAKDGDGAAIDAIDELFEGLDARPTVEALASGLDLQPEALLQRRKRRRRAQRTG